MARPMQKRKQRSSRATMQTHNRSRKPLVPTGSDVVARNWDKKLTLTQNYRKLGLVSRLKAPSGGVEKSLRAATAAAKPPSSNPTASTKRTAKKSKPDSLAILPAEARILGETRVERDADGRIVRVIHNGDNPLNDPLARFDSDSESGSESESTSKRVQEDEEDTRTEVVRQLEEQANAPIVKKARHASEQETKWLSALVRRHGSDTGAMARDRRMNKMQQTEADIARRLKKAFGDDWAREGTDLVYA